MTRKVLYVVSNVTNSTEYEQLVDHWDRARFELEFVFLNPVPECAVQDYIRKAGFASTTIPYHGRKDAVGSVRSLMAFYKRTRPDIIHLNLLEATFYGLIAAKLTGIGATVYTRHHSTHNHKYHPVKGVLYDKLNNRMTDRIIAITHSTEEVLVDWEKVPKEKVTLIYHGYELDRVPKPEPAHLAELARKHGIRTDGRNTVIGMIARPFEWKGLDHSIPAFAEVLASYPDAKLIIFNWKGTPHSDRYEAMLRKLPAGSWHTVNFEPEVVQLFHVFDVFVHVPEDQHAEAFGLVYAESLMAGVPCVFTRSGFMHDLDPSSVKGVKVVPFKDSEQIAQRTMEWLATPPSKADREAFAAHNVEVLRRMISIELKMEALYRLYDSM